MKLYPELLMCVLLCGSVVSAADSADRASITKMHDSAISSIEKEVVSLAEAMPADKYNFAPKSGSFEGARTFGQQMSHIATANYEFAAGILGEKSPVEDGTHENGPDSLRSKEAIVKYLKGSFELAHRAANSLTEQNFLESVKLSWGKETRGALIDMIVSHSFDHYGQAVVYARMNGIVPPASRKQS